jgi:hypothetical protein
VRKRATEAGWSPGVSYTSPVVGKPPQTGTATVKPLTDAARYLVELAQKKPLTLESACDALGWPPAAVRKLAADAAASGYAIEFSGDGDELSWRVPEPSDTVIDTGVEPVLGRPFRVAVISDLHFGSKWCGRSQMRDFLNRVRDMGITRVLGPGDNLDGVYRHSLWEQSHRGFSEQADDFGELWRDYPDLFLDFIDGNHCDTLSESCGMEAGRALVERMRGGGVTNLQYHGTRSAFLRMGGATVHLWHPRGSGSYALSYKLQKKVEGYAPGQKPDVLLTGHYHQFCYVNERGVHGLLCPTFQLPGGSFSNSLVGSPAVGGLILSWDLTDGGTLRDFDLRRVSYYAGERPREIAA